MSQDETPKRGMFSRLFGRGKAADEGKADEATTADATEIASPEIVDREGVISEAAIASADAVVAEQDVAPEPVDDEVEKASDVAATEPAEVDPRPASDTSSSVVASDELSPGELTSKGEPSSAAETAPIQASEPDTSPNPDEAEEKPRQGWFSRLKSGLAKSSSKLTTGIAEVFTKRKLDGAMLEDLEDLLIQSDLGVEPAMEITEALRASRFDKDISPQEVKEFLAGEIERRLEPVALPLVIPDAPRPYVILVVGVNGSGKTTTIGKLAAKFGSEGKKIVLAAGDTFRAAAIDQLKIWGSRVGATVVARDVGSDAAGLVFDAHQTAVNEGADVLLIDTAGRLQNKSDLMAELEKVVRVLSKKEPGAPHAVLLVLDATVGQNAISQATVFGEIAGVTGLVMTKLDGTARGGILVALAAKFGLPVHAIGVGEQVNDLQAFSAAEFARAIAGTDAASDGDMNKMDS